MRILFVASVKQFGPTILYGSRLLEALFILAGEEFHAARLRPKVGQVASIEETDDGDEPGDGERGGGEPGDGEPGGGEPGGGEPGDGERGGGEPGGR